MTLTETTRTRTGWTHSFPVCKLPAPECWMDSSESLADACDVQNVLYAGGFIPKLGKSEKVIVAAAVHVIWTVFVDGDEAEVAAAREWLKQWRNPL